MHHNIKKEPEMSKASRKNLGTTARTYLEAKVECKCSSESEFVASTIVFLSYAEMFEQKRKIDVPSFLDKYKESKESKTLFN